MPISEILVILVAGFGAGAINAVVGSGTLITFPTLIAFGYPPVVATMSNA
ncbi:MAG: sulfite exporter TauE/SafE family protein, partial [Rhodococcus sp. (in: high G+C Gram-positive bacteria)]